MVKKRSTTRKRNHDDASSTKRFKPWSDLNHDVLSIVMMQLGVIDFVSFSGVSKSWRSFALRNMKRFMASKPPMLMRISNHGYKKKCYCYLEDIDGRKFRTILPHSSRRVYVGLTSGYFILFGRKTRDFLLVNPITRHELHFPNAPYCYVCCDFQPTIKATLVFSPTMSRWIFILLDMHTYKTWFSIEGKGEWNQVSTTFSIHDFHAFNGKIYTINHFGQVYEISFYPNLTLTLLEIKNFGNLHFLYLQLVKSGKNLYVLNYSLQGGFQDRFKLQELDFSKMEWVVPQKTREKYAFFVSKLNYYDGINLQPWADPWSQYEKISVTPGESRKYRFFVASRWYFPHDCTNHEC